MLRIPTKPNPVKKKHIIKVIKVNRCSKFWEDEHLTKYYYSNIDDKPHIYGFFNEQDAQRCLDFLNIYKKFNFKYPNEITPTTYMHKELVIEDEPISAMQHRCSLAGIGLLGISEFDYQFTLNSFQIDYRAIHLVDHIPISYDEYIDNLEHIFQF
jgi:hypothetical protein